MIHAENRRLTTIAVRVVVAAVAWWAIAEGSTRGWGFAIVGIVAAAWVSLVVYPRRRWRLRPWLGLAWSFAVGSVRGGIAVARLAYARRAAAASAFVRYRTRLPEHREQVLLTNLVSLMPGTVTCELTEGELLVHVLDDVDSAVETIRVCEAHIAAVFDDAP